MVFGGIIIIVIAIVLYIIAYNTKYIMIGAWSGILIYAGIIMCFDGSNPKLTPTALDVYRGKTTLEITYRDGVAIDSVVVYKK